MMKGWKTIILGVAVAAAGALQAVELVDWIALVGEESAGAIMTGIGVAVTVLRFFTNTPAMKG